MIKLNPNLVYLLSRDYGWDAEKLAVFNLENYPGSRLFNKLLSFGAGMTAAVTAVLSYPENIRTLANLYETTTNIQSHHDIEVHKLKNHRLYDNELYRLNLAKIVASCEKEDCRKEIVDLTNKYLEIESENKILSGFRVLREAQAHQDSSQ
jgi:hypothetical protein